MTKCKFNRDEREIIAQDINKENIGFCICLLKNSHDKEDVGVCWFDGPRYSEEQFTVQEAAKFGGMLTYAASLSIIQIDTKD